MNSVLPSDCRVRPPPFREVRARFVHHVTPTTTNRTLGKKRVRRRGKTMHTPSSPPFANVADGKVAIKKHTIFKRILNAPRLILVDRRGRLVGEEVVLAK